LKHTVTAVPPVEWNENWATLTYGQSQAYCITSVGPCGNQFGTIAITQTLTVMHVQIATFSNCQMNSILFMLFFPLLDE